MEQIIEVLIKKKTKLKDRVIQGLLGVAVIFVNILCLSLARIVLKVIPIEIISTVCFIVNALSLVAIYYIIQSNRIEFEYILVNDELDIDKIIAQRKRKKIITIKKSSIVSFDKVASSEYQKYKKKTRRFIKAMSDEKSKDNYYIALSDNKNTLIVLDRNDNIYKVLRKR